MPKCGNIFGTVLFNIVVFCTKVLQKPKQFNMESCLKEYQIQLQMMEETLILEPENKNFLELKAELEEAIKLTQEICQIQQISAENTPTSGDEADVTMAATVDHALEPAAKSCDALQETGLVHKNSKRRNTEIKKKRQEKKKERLQRFVAESEGAKNKCQSFSKGIKRTSIFATTEHHSGQTGVGTSGTSGKPMTTSKAGPMLKKISKK